MWLRCASAQALLGCNSGCACTQLHAMLHGSSFVPLAVIQRDVGL